MPEPVRYLLPESEIPTTWTNLMADLGPPEHPPLHPGTQQPLSPEDLAPLFPMPARGESGEGGIRTHEAAFTAHTISSRAP